MVLFIDCEIVRACHMCVLALAEDLEDRTLKSSAQTKAPGNTPRAKARPTQDGRRGSQRTAGAGRWVSSKSVPTENPRRFHYLEQSDLQEKFSMFNMCINAVLLYQYRHFDGCRGKNEKYLIVTTRPVPLSLIHI